MHKEGAMGGGYPGGGGDEVGRFEVDEDEQCRHWQYLNEEQPKLLQEYFHQWKEGVCVCGLCVRVYVVCVCALVCGVCMLVRGVCVLVCVCGVYVCVCACMWSVCAWCKYVCGSEV